MTDPPSVPDGPSGPATNPSEVPAVSGSDGTPAGPAAAQASTGPTLSLFRFTIEGRQAPGLFVAGWIASLIGGSAAFVGLLSGQNLAGALLFVAGLALVLPGLVLLGGSQAIERRQAGLRYAGPSPIVTFLAVVAGWYLAAVAIATPLQVAGLDLTGPAVALLGVSIQALVVVGILRLMVVGSGALSWHDMGVRRPDAAALRDLAWGAVFAAPVVLVTGVVVYGLVTVIGQQPASPLPPTGSAGGLAINLLAGAVIAPLYEELFFRGFTLTAWLRMTTVRAAIIRSAILFALVHAIDQTGSTFAAALGVAVVAAAARLPVAIVLGWVFEQRKSLWASIGLHATFNAILLIVAERALIH